MEEEYLIDESSYLGREWNEENIGECQEKDVVGYNNRTEVSRK